MKTKQHLISILGLAALLFAISSVNGSSALARPDMSEDGGGSSGSGDGDGGGNTTSADDPYGGAGAWWLMATATVSTTSRPPPKNMKGLYSYLRNTYRPGILPDDDGYFGSGGAPGSGSSGSSSDGDLSARLDERACNTMKSLIENASKNTKPVAQQIADAISDDTKVVFIGEDHYDLKSRYEEQRLIEALSQKGFDCLYFELPSNENVFKNISPANQEELCHNLSTEYNMAIFTPSVLAASAAKCHGMYVSTFDYPQATGNGGVAEYETRNIYMATILNEMVKSGACNKAIAINGSLHVNFDAVDGSAKSIPSLITAGKTFTVDLYSKDNDPQTNLPYAQYVMPKGCDAYNYSPDPIVISGQSTISGLYPYTNTFGNANPIRLDGKRAIVIY